MVIIYRGLYSLKNDFAERLWVEGLEGRGWGAIPYLGEVANKVATFAVVLGQDVEKEGLHIIVEGLVVQEELGQQTQVLTVDCAHIPINLLRD